MFAVSQSCLEEKLRAYDEELKNFSIARDEDSVYFIGNGYIGVGDDGGDYLPISFSRERERAKIISLNL